MVDLLSVLRGDAYEAALRPREFIEKSLEESDVASVARISEKCWLASRGRRGEEPAYTAWECGWTSLL